MTGEGIVTAFALGIPIILTAFIAVFIASKLRT